MQLPHFVGSGLEMSIHPSILYYGKYKVWCYVVLIVKWIAGFRKCELSLS